jgi:nucleotide-binding universal stress UspA family protein
MTESSPVVVGVDGSDEALAAVEWAAREAVIMRRALRVVHAFEWAEFPVSLGPPAGAPDWTGLANAARQILGEAQERARTATSGVVVTAESIAGFARPVLLAEASTAALMVVASRGLGGVGSLLIGSTGLELAARAPCPVAVVPREARPRAGAEIVVGVDCSQSSRPALEFAFAEAERRGVELAVILAWQGEGSRAAFSTDDPPADQEPTREGAHARLAAFVEPVRQKHPEVTAHVGARFAAARTFLTERAVHAGLLVVGSRGYGAAKGLFAGSVSQAVLHHARCPVVVVPAAPQPA